MKESGLPHSSNHHNGIDIRKTVIITRPRERAEKTAQKLRELGFVPLVDSMLSVEYCFNEQERSPVSPSACIVTSQNAVPTLSLHGIPHDTPIFAVGTATTAHLKEHKYENVFTASGHARSIVRLIQQHMEGNGETIIHFSGEEIRYDPGPELVNAGFDFHRKIVYRTHEAQVLNPETIHAILAHKVLAVLFYSPKTARCFCRLATELEEHLANVTAICLGKAIGEELPEIFKKIAIAEKIDEDAILDALKREEYHERQNHKS